MSIPIRGISLSAALILLSLPANADFTVCNHSTENVSVAIAYVSPHGGFTSEGWWSLRACGECKKVMNRNQTTDPHNVFFHAHGGGLVWEGRDHFCTRGDAFTMNGKSCAARDMKGF